MQQENTLPSNKSEKDSTNEELPEIKAAEEKEEHSTNPELPAIEAEDLEGVGASELPVETELSSTLTDFPAMTFQPSADTDNSLADGNATLVDIPALGHDEEVDDSEPPTDPMAAAHDAASTAGTNPGTEAVGLATDYPTEEHENTQSEPPVKREDIKLEEEKEEG